MKKTPWTERFWPKVNKTATCWLWTGGQNGYGYGALAVTRHRARLAHRLSWELTHGAIPDGICVLHRCDNRLCLNPDHLFLGTKSDNTKDRHIKNRTARGDDFTLSKLTEANVIDLRRRYALLRRYSKGPIAALRGEFQISQTTLYDVVHRRTWTHI